MVVIFAFSVARKKMSISKQRLSLLQEVSADHVAKRIWRESFSFRKKNLKRNLRGYLDAARGRATTAGMLLLEVLCITQKSTHKLNTGRNHFTTV